MSQPQRSKTMPAAAPTKHLKLSLKDIPCIPPPPPPVPLRLKLLGAGCALLIPVLIPIAFHILPLLIEPVDAPCRFAGGLAACIAWLTAFASCMAVVVMVLIEGMMVQLVYYVGMFVMLVTLWPFILPFAMFKAAQRERKQRDQQQQQQQEQAADKQVKTE